MSDAPRRTEVPAYDPENNQLISKLRGMEAIE